MLLCLSLVKERRLSSFEFHKVKHNTLRIVNTFSNFSFPDDAFNPPNVIRNSCINPWNPSEPTCPSKWRYTNYRTKDTKIHNFINFQWSSRISLQKPIKIAIAKRRGIWIEFSYLTSVTFICVGTCAYLQIINYSHFQSSPSFWIDLTTWFQSKKLNCGFS